MTSSNSLKRAFPYLLLTGYGLFLCSYFIFDEYSEPYRFFARGVFLIGVFVFAGGVRATWRQPLFQAVIVYMVYLLLSAFWSEPMEWFRLGQKFVISVYIISFITITYFLAHWNHRQFERMLRLCVAFASLAALLSIVFFYRDHPFPATRLEGIGALTNVNIFANVYGIFAILAMGFSLRAETLPQRTLFLLAVGLFICFAWFGQSRTAFVSMLIALSLLVGLSLQQGKVLYASALVILGGALIAIFPDVLEQALLRGQGLRPLIWAQAWEEAKSAPLIGHGLLSMIAVQSQQHVFETIHNAYLQVLWHGGLIGLCLFLVVLTLAFCNAWTQGRQRRDYTIFCMLVFTACIMMTGVDTLIARPRDQWMVFWLPVALLLSYKSMAPRPTPPESAS